MWCLNSHANIFTDNVQTVSELLHSSFFLWTDKTFCLYITSADKNMEESQRAEETVFGLNTNEAGKITICSLFSTCQTNMLLTFLYSKKKTQRHKQNELNTAIQTGSSMKDEDKINECLHFKMYYLNTIRHNISKAFHPYSFAAVQKFGKIMSELLLERCFWSTG